jgi:hypothetical protein
MQHLGSTDENQNVKKLEPICVLFFLTLQLFLDQFGMTFKFLVARNRLILIFKN